MNNTNFQINATIQKDVDLSSLSTFGIGGKITEYVQVSSPEEIIEVLQWIKKEKKTYYIFAGGSNVVFPDAGLVGVGVQIKSGKYAEKMRELTFDAGFGLSDAVNYMTKNGLQGIETLAGIPGTVGGAIVGNAGAYGHSIAEVISKVEIWDGKIRRWLSREECQFTYRESIFKHTDWVVLRASLQFDKGNKDELLRVSTNIIRLREAKYHPGIRCPGSFFKNVLVQNVSPDSLALIDQDVIIDGKIPAGYLLGEVGAKDMKVGGIKIASYHGNLFVNTGLGTARDVKELAGTLKHKVKEKFGILLEEEIRYF